VWDNLKIWRFGDLKMGFRSQQLTKRIINNKEDYVEDPEFACRY
jgi:hypothetical protein